ncbi:hypothetical protein OH76DRAFT_1350553, partial [Lentinus brumalis]
MSAEALITPNSKSAPTFGEGKITPANMNSWEHQCVLFFRERDTAEDKMVQKASFGFANELLQDWYLANQDLIDEMDWKTFVAAMRTRFLPRGWASKIRSDIIAKRMDSSEHFDDFIMHVEKLNARLRNTDARLDDAAFRTIVSANLVEELNHACLDDDIADIVSFQDWKAAISNLDAKRHRLLDIVKNSVSARTSGKTSSGSGNVPRSSGSGNGSGVSAGSKGSGIPKLTDGDRKLLNEHSGCYKCRRFYAGHLANECKTWPNPATYQPLSQKLALEAKAAKDNPRTRATAAAVTDEVDDNTVAAVGLTSPNARASCILGSGSDSEVYVAPLYSPHTILSACILSSTVESSAISTLIDSGAHTVLIRQDIVEQLQLPQHPLPQPYKLGNAWGTEERESKVYVKLRIALPDFSWTSVTCRAIVVPSLCAPVILGKPFLESNKLVEDHAARTLLHKPSGINLLQHVDPTPVHPQQPKERREQQPLRRLNADKHTIDATVAAVTAVRERVETLAYIETLHKENNAIKLEYADLFPDDIPHITRLPTDVYHRFVLKDANMKIVRRQYDCPKKYREAWK